MMAARRRISGLEHVVSMLGLIGPADVKRVAGQLLAEAESELSPFKAPSHFAPALSVQDIPHDQRVALTWRLRNVLAQPCDLDAAFALRGGLLTLIAELEGAGSGLAPDGPGGES